MENMLPLAEGGATRRSGTRFIKEIKTSSVKGRLTRFEFSTTQAYIIEMGEQLFRFYRNQAQITANDITASITNGTFTGNITNWSDVSSGGGSIAHDATNDRLNLVFSTTEGHAEQQVTNALAAEHVLRFRVLGAPGDSILLQVGTATGGTQLKSFTAKVGWHAIAFTATAANFFVQFKGNSTKTVQIDDVSLLDNAAIEITTPYTEAQLFTVDGPQSADVLYLFHASHPTYKLERRGHTTWSLIEVAWQDGPWQEENETTTTMTAAAATGLGVNITASAITGINGDTGFQSTDIGRLIRITDGGTVNWGWGVIVSITSTTVVVVDIKRTFTVTTAETRWQLGAWSSTTGYPSTGAFFEQRLAAANTTDQPQTFWLSQTGDIENHGPDSAPESSGGSIISSANVGGIATFNTVSVHGLKTGQKVSQSGIAESTYNFDNQEIEVVDSDTYKVLGLSFVTTTAVGAFLLKDTFDGTVEDDDAINVTISADDVNAIFWMSAGEDTLVMGTAGGEWVPSAPNAAVLTPSNIAVRRQVTRKSADIEPVRVDNIVLFVQRGKRKLLEFGFTFESDGFQVVNVTRLAEHITRGGIVEMDFAEELDSIVWTVREDGVMPTMTFRREEDVVAWSRQILGGQFAGGNALTATDISFTTTTTIGSVAKAFGVFKAGDVLFISGTASNDFSDIGLVTIASISDDLGTITTTETTIVTEAAGSSFTLTAMKDAVVESVAVIPGTNGSGQTQDSTDRDEVWVIVKRTINGTTKRFVEMFERDFEDEDDQEDSYYSDSLLTYDSTETTTITGLSHLEGETVKVFADGGLQADKTVSSGSITIDIAASVVQVGLGYTHNYKTLRFEGGNPAGTAIGKDQRIVNVTFGLLNSHTITFGPNDDSLETREFRVVSDSMDAAAPFFTGDQKYEFEDGWTTDSRIVIKSEDPVPFTLLGLAPEFQLNAVI